ncbi:MAG TPA: NADPH-dependent glutamate synthase [Candidatus Bathyarchaeia archaeon]|nr:MAG: glutamate synthase (NADPH), homotetrameric [Candidatus Bathyarchaeota archaeon RBG_16_48_13]HJX23733.1 NADPH-dependent glutamate synthase [Candidatus Bathyarchaeia archaeon]
MPKQPIVERIKNFNEVALGFEPDQAIMEASRCLQCQDPQCRRGCPVGINITSFCGYVREGNFDKAISVIRESNSLPAICGRVCPQESQCEAYCAMGQTGSPLAIGALERFLADYELKKGITMPSIAPITGKKVAVIGSGPAGLTVAGDLAKLGHIVSIFEALHTPGGVLAYGIPEFRLPKSIVAAEVDYVKRLGAKLETNMVIGKIFTIDELVEMGYQAIFLGTGAGSPYFLSISGENLNGVYSANEFLTRCNLMKSYLFPEYDTPLIVGKEVVVIGGGNVTMDSARTALRLGVEKVHVVYRRSEQEMPARREEVLNAKDEGILFNFLTYPLRLIGNSRGWVEKVECGMMELCEPDETGRRRPVPIPNHSFTIDAQTVIIAIGQGPNPLLSKVTKDLETDRDGRFIADEWGRTSKRGIWSGGDVATGWADATVINAMGTGKRAASSIHQFLTTGQW